MSKLSARLLVAALLVVPATGMAEDCSVVWNSVPSYQNIVCDITGYIKSYSVYNAQANSSKWTSSFVPAADLQGTPFTWLGSELELPAGGVTSVKSTNYPYDYIAVYDNAYLSSIVRAYEQRDKVRISVVVFRGGCPFPGNCSGIPGGTYVNKVTIVH